MRHCARPGQWTAAAVIVTTLMWLPAGTRADAAVIDVAGTWDDTESLDGTCTILGESDDIGGSAAGVVVIDQDGTSVSMTVPGTDVRRTGTIDGNVIRISGPAAIPLGGGGVDVRFTSNVLTATGTIAPNREVISFTGAATAGGTVCIPEGCAPFSCSATLHSTFRRPLVSVSVQAPPNCGGTVVSEPRGIACGPDCAEGFARGATVALDAIPNAGATFRSWTGRCQGRGTCRVAAVDATTIGAQFACASPLVSAVLPGSRSVQKNGTATAFATIINTGTTAASGCAISKDTAVPASFTYQATGGAPNTPVAIPPGAAQNFVIALTASDTFAPTDTQFRFACSGALPADSVSGLNTLLLSASTAPPPDIVALAATTGNNGIVDVRGVPRTGAFAVATVNVGASGFITASAESSPPTLPVSLRICRTNAATGECTAPPSSPTVSIQINSGETPTFAVFVTATGNVTFDPAGNRIFVRFNEPNGTVRGATSVAVRTTD